MFVLSVNVLLEKYAKSFGPMIGLTFLYKSTSLCLGVCGAFESMPRFVSSPPRTNS